jgi:hypothetical protein
MRNQWIGGFLLAGMLSSPVLAESHSGGAVMITGSTQTVNVSLYGEECAIERNQSKNNPVHEMYNTTNRGKIQPIDLGHGIETIGELELIDFMKQAETDSSIVIVDTRTPGLARQSSHSMLDKCALY